jgi:ribonuclease D
MPTWKQRAGVARLCACAAAPDPAGGGADTLKQSSNYHEMFQIGPIQPDHVRIEAPCRPASAAMRPNLVEIRRGLRAIVARVAVASAPAREYVRGRQRRITKGSGMANHLYQGDLPDGLDLGPVVAIDCETMGLNPHRDRLCVVQLSGGDGSAHLVQVAIGQTKAPNLCRLLEDPAVLKLFHFGRFDIAAMYHAFGALAQPVYCTKIASRLVRTFTDRHGLKALTQELLGVDISKQQQTSDWGAADLSSAQVDYAASDVLYLHRLRDALDAMLAREGRSDLAQACFDFLPTRARLDLAGWPEIDIFAHA